jgi:hypothetical protein
MAKYEHWQASTMPTLWTGVKPSKQQGCRPIAMRQEQSLLAQTNLHAKTPLVRDQVGISQDA